MLTSGWTWSLFSLLSYLLLVEASNDSSVARRQDETPSWQTWGPYRPNLYFGVRPQIPETFLMGLMWASGESRDKMLKSTYPPPNGTPYVTTNESSSFQAHVFYLQSVNSGLQHCVTRASKTTACADMAGPHTTRASAVPRPSVTPSSTLTLLRTSSSQMMGTAGLFVSLEFPGRTPPVA